VKWTPSIKSLYPFALAEGEGIGTAYEYVAKARVLDGLISRVSTVGRRPRIVVAGLPQKYGTSLDFAILAQQMGAETVIVDERPSALERARNAIESLQRTGALPGLHPEFRQVSLSALAEVGTCDAVLSSEVLQRVEPPLRRDWVMALRGLASTGALFVPNADNRAHLDISGLPGVTRSEMHALFADARLAYVDMPPFPPGITRNPEQRQKASSGAMEAMAMRVLDAYCYAERLVPDPLKKRVAHIVCAVWGV
jgi:hypothetical protein